MATVLATDLVVGRQYRLANTLNIRYSDPGYQQRLLSRPHILLQKEDGLYNDIILEFLADGIGEYGVLNPRIWVFGNQEFIQYLAPPPPLITSPIPAARKGGKRKAKGTKHRKNRKRKASRAKTMNKRR